MHRLGFLASHELMANVVLIAVGTLMMILGDRLEKGRVAETPTDPAADRAADDD